MFAKAMSISRLVIIRYKHRNTAKVVAKVPDVLKSLERTSTGLNEEKVSSG